MPCLIACFLAISRSRTMIRTSASSAPWLSRLGPRGVAAGHAIASAYSAMYA